MCDERAPKRDDWTTVCGAAAMALVGATAHAHHSFAMYDQTKQDTYTGKLIRFIPGANHAQLLFELVDTDGKPANQRRRQADYLGRRARSCGRDREARGTVESFPLGTVITVTLNPLRNGKTFGAMAQGARLIRCGSAVPSGGCTAETGEVFLASRNWSRRTAASSRRCAQQRGSGSVLSFRSGASWRRARRGGQKAVCMLLASAVVHGPALTKNSDNRRERGPGSHPRRGIAPSGRRMTAARSRSITFAT